MEHGLWPALVMLGVFLFFFGPFRHRAGLRHRMERQAGRSDGRSEDSERLERLDRRLAELDSLDGRVAELENRLDFTERLLAARREEPSGGR